MAMRLTTLRAPDGSIFYLQYDEEESDELRAVGAVEDLAERTQHFTDTLVSTIRGCAALVLHSVQQSLSDFHTPTRVTMEFGLQVGGEAGIPFVTKGTTQANVKVAIDWTLGQSRGGS